MRVCDGAHAHREREREPSDLPMIIGHSGFSETAGEDSGRGGALFYLSRGRILNETGGSINVLVSRQVERRRRGIEADSTAR